MRRRCAAIGTGTGTGGGPRVQRYEKPAPAEHKPRARWRAPSVRFDRAVTFASAFAFLLLFRLCPCQRRGPAPVKAVTMASATEVAAQHQEQRGTLDAAPPPGSALALARSAFRSLRRAPGAAPPALVPDAREK